MKPYAANRYTMIMMCQCSFINCNKCTRLVCNIDNERGYACMWAESIWKMYLPLNFAVKLHCSNKIKSLKI